MTATMSAIAFPGAPNLPMFAALEEGFLAEAGLDVRLETTPSSVRQFELFGQGAFDIAFTAFDNVVAYAEGQGVAPFADGRDLCAVFGCTALELSLVAAKGIGAVAQLRGRTIALDAPSTGFAFVLYEMLRRNGVSRAECEAVAVGATPERWRAVRDGQHAATITIEPFTTIARGAGFPVLARSGEILPAYLGGVIAVRRSWAERHGDTLTAFLRAYRRSVRWVLDPANRERAAALLAARMPEIQPAGLAAVMASLLAPATGLVPDGVIDPAGARAVLALRTRFGSADAPLDDVDRYLDLRWMEAAG